jgi:hypothetical protein
MGFVLEMCGRVLKSIQNIEGGYENAMGCERRSGSAVSHVSGKWGLFAEHGNAAVAHPNQRT